jgi:PmbA protein
MATDKGVPALVSAAEQAVELARKAGAREVAAEAGRERNVEVQWRDGKLEKISEATTRSLTLRLYVDGRYAAVATSDLRPEALGSFIDNAIVLTRKIEPDPLRSLPDPKYYRDRPEVDLTLSDPRHGEVSAVERRRLTEATEAAARASKDGGRILSMTANFSDSFSDSYLVASNGFSGSQQGTSFWIAADVSMKDGDGRRPEDYAYAGARFFGELPGPEVVGREAATRTAGRLGSQKGKSAVMPVVIDSRAGGRLLSALMSALNGRALQQKQSFLEGKQGLRIGSAALSFDDDPLIKKGFASRLFDGEGISARRLPIFKDGVLTTYYINDYYGKKLGMAPTTGSNSNLTWKLGDKDQAKLIADAKDGVFITSFLGGNSNSTTGDFSFGFSGYRIHKGALAEPISEMNLSGNHLEVWKRLAAVGNDPYPYSSLRHPTLLFDGVQVAGT